MSCREADAAADGVVRAGSPAAGETAAGCGRGGAGRPGRVGRGRLRTHKLHGELVGSWACSAGYDLRVVFAFVEHDGAEAVLLQSVGTHDEVY